MSGLPGPGALIRTNYDRTVLRVLRTYAVPAHETCAHETWTFICRRADDPRDYHGQDDGGLYYEGGWRLVGTRFLGPTYPRNTAMYQAIYGRGIHGGPEAVCELFVVAWEPQLQLFPPAGAKKGSR